MFSNQVLGALAQLLGSSPSHVVRTVLNKHFDNVSPDISDMGSYFEFIRWGADDRVTALVVDVLLHPKSTREEASKKGVFDERFADLRGWLAHDGWELKGDKLLSSLPAIEESTGVRDRLIELLDRSVLDETGEVRELLDSAAKAFQSDPPELNPATVNVRIALETIGRRGAGLLAKKLEGNAVELQWGPAITYLRKNGILDLEEENAVTSTYTLISDGAHVPKGMSEIEWARVSRTLALSLTYFLVQKLHDGL